MQTGEDNRFLKAIVTLKHWDAYSLEDSDGFARYNFNAIVSAFALADTYWPAFEKSVKVGGAQGVMAGTADASRIQEPSYSRLTIS